MQSLAAPFANAPSQQSSEEFGSNELPVDISSDNDSVSNRKAKPTLRPPKAGKREDMQGEEEQQPQEGGIQVTQEIVRDNETGQVFEETKVTFKGADAEALTGGHAVEGEEGLMGTDEQAREAVENARRLIESLKDDGVLQSGAATSKRGREVDDDGAEDDGAEVVEVEEEEENAQPGVFRRFFGGGKKQKKATRTSASRRPELGELQVMQSPDGAQVLVAQTIVQPQQPNRRRFVAMAGMVVMGAATAAAPYLFS